MTSSSFFILSLLLVSAYSQFLKTSKNNDIHTILTEMDRNHFGSSVLSTVATHLNAEGPIEDIDSLLNELKTQLTNDQQADDTQHEKDVAECSSSIENYKNQIAFHTNGLATSQETLAVEQKGLANDESSLRTTEGDIEQNRVDYAAQERTRNEQHADYEEKMNEHKDAIAAVEECASLIKQLQYGTLFVQLKSRFAKITERLEKHKHRHALYAPVIRSLAEIASKADQESVKKILGLLDDLKKALEESRDRFIAEENTQADNWKVSSENLNNDYKRLTEEKDRLEKSIVSHKDKIGVAENDIALHQKGLEDNELGLKNKEAACELLNKNYEEIKAERTKELECLEKVINLLRERLGGMKEWIKEKVNVDF